MNLAAILLQVSFFVVPTGTADKKATWDYPELSSGVVDEFRLYVVHVPSYRITDPVPVVDPTTATLVGNVAATASPLEIPLGAMTQPGAYFYAATAYDADSDVESEVSNVLPLFALGPPLNLGLVPGPIASLKDQTKGFRLVD